MLRRFVRGFDRCVILFFFAKTARTTIKVALFRPKYLLAIGAPHPRIYPKSLEYHVCVRLFVVTYLGHEIVRRVASLFFLHPFLEEV